MIIFPKNTSDLLRHINNEGSNVHFHIGALGATAAALLGSFAYPITGLAGLNIGLTGGLSLVVGVAAVAFVIFYGVSSYKCSQLISQLDSKELLFAGFALKDEKLIRKAIEMDSNLLKGCNFSQTFGFCTEDFSFKSPLQIVIEKGLSEDLLGYLIGKCKDEPILYDGLFISRGNEQAIKILMNQDGFEASSLPPRIEAWLGLLQNKEEWILEAMGREPELTNHPGIEIGPVGNGPTIVGLAVQKGMSLDFIKRAFEDHEAKNHVSGWDFTVMRLAAAAGRLDVVQYLVEEQGISPSGEDRSHILSQDERDQVQNDQDRMDEGVVDLVEVGDRQHSNVGLEGAPLHRAVSGGHKDIARYLIESRAELDSCDLRNRSPLELAALKWHYQNTELDQELALDVINAIHQLDSFPDENIFLSQISQAASTFEVLPEDSDNVKKLKLIVHLSLSKNSVDRAQVIRLINRVTKANIDWNV